MMFNGPCYFEIPADNMEALKGFYSDLFDWKMDKVTGGDSDYVMINIDGEPRGGMLSRQHPEHYTINYICVENIDSSLKRARELGAGIIVGKMAVKGMGWYAVLKDPQGNNFGLWQDDAGAE